MAILLIGGSPSAPSLSTRLLHYASERLASLGHRTQHLQVRDLPAQALLQAHFDNAELNRAKELVSDAEAVVIATPVYKAAYSGVLKAFLDLLPQDGLKNKLVLPLATGGGESHMLALDYALRPVLSALGALRVLASVYATDAQLRWSEPQGLELDAGIDARVADGVQTLCRELAAQHALRAAWHEIEPVRCSA